MITSVDVNRWAAEEIWETIDAAFIIAGREPDPNPKANMPPQTLAVLGAIKSAIAIGRLRPIRVTPTNAYFLAAELATWAAEKGYVLAPGLSDAVMTNASRFVAFHEQRKIATSAAISQNFAPKAAMDCGTRKTAEPVMNSGSAALKSERATVTNGGRVDLYALVTEVSRHLAARKPEPNDLRQEIRTSVARHGWPVDDLPSAQARILSMHSRGEIVVMNEHDDLPPDKIEEVCKLEKWYVSVDDANKVRSIYGLDTASGNSSASADHSAEDWMSLFALIAGFVSGPAASLPPELKVRVDQEFWPHTWDSLSPEQRCAIAQQLDIQHDPSLERLNQKWFDHWCQVDQIKRQIAEWEAMGHAGIPSEARIKEEKIFELRAELTKLEGAMGSVLSSKDMTKNDEHGFLRPDLEVSQIRDEAELCEYINNDKLIDWQYWAEQMPKWTPAEAARLLCALDPEVFESYQNRPNTNDQSLAIATARKIQRLAEAQEINSLAPAKWVEWADAHGLPVHYGLRLVLEVSREDKSPDQPVTEQHVKTPIRGSHAVPMPRQRWQEQEILRVIKEIGHDPTMLPVFPKGKPTVKAEVRAILGSREWHGTVFDKAWERLRASGEIANFPSDA